MTHDRTLTLTFMHLADAFIQSDLHCIQVTVLHFYQLLLSLGIEPMILALHLEVTCSLQRTFNGLMSYVTSFLKLKLLCY